MLSLLPQNPARSARTSRIAVFFAIGRNTVRGRGMENRRGRQIVYPMISRRRAALTALCRSDCDILACWIESGDQKRKLDLGQRFATHYWKE